MVLLSRYGSRSSCCQRATLLAALASFVGSSWIIGSVNANFLDAPSLRWTFSLEGGGDNALGIPGRSLRQGNAVVASPGGDKLFVTADDASLHILDLSGDGEAPTTLAVFEPEGMPRTFTECRSGVTVVESSETTASSSPLTPYLVYAVVDTPLASSPLEWDGTQLVGSNNSDQISSRVIALNMDGTLRWTVDVDGTIVGNPVVGSNGRLLYVSHTDVANKGFLSVLLTNEDGTSAELTASLSPAERDAPLGPPAIQRTLLVADATTMDAFTTTIGDRVVVAENWDDGYTEEGSIYVLLPSPDFEDAGGRGPESYQLLLVSRSSWTFSAVMAPLFVDSSLWLGGTSSNLAGWTDNRDLTNVLLGLQQDVDPRWSLQLETNARNASQPFLTTPEISPDGAFLYLAGASRNFYCLQTTNGRESWSVPVESAILNRPTLFTSEDGQSSAVYVIESMDGRVRQFNSENGGENWQFNCGDITGIASCQNAVEADFSVSDSGNVVYYGDIFGRISALEVATFVTEAPSAMPSATATLSPSKAPSSSPAPMTTTSAPTGSLPVVGGVFDNTDNPLGATDGSNNDDSSNETLSMGVIIGAAVGGLAVVAFVAFFVAKTLLKPTKKKKKTKTTATKEVRERDIENDLDGSGDDDDSDSAVSMDDVSVNSASEGVEVEVGEGAQPYQTPKKSKRKKNRRMSRIRTPPTASTLDAIEEAEDEEPATPAGAAGAGPKADLDKKFQATEVQKGGVGHAEDGHIELAVGLNKLRNLADDLSAASDDESTLPPPPPPDATPSSPKPSRGITEEKKDEDSADGAAHGTISPKPSFGMKGDQRPTSPTDESTSTSASFIAQVKAALKYTRSPKSPRSSNGDSTPAIAMSPSMLSTDSSLYTNDDNKSRVSTSNLSPMSTVFGGPEQGARDHDSIPDDEMAGMLEPPSLSHKYNSNRETAAPGAHYLNKGSSLRPKFKPASAATVPKVKSARPKKNLNGFSGSYLNTSEEASGSDDEGRIRTKAAAPADSKKAPSFKRRTKREDQPPPEPSSMESTWNSFLQELADAEKAFFSPTHAQKSAVLRYSNPDESFEEETATGTLNDDDDTVNF